MVSSEQTLEITEGSARRADPESVKTLLKSLPMPIAEDLNTQLASVSGGFAGMRYDAETQRAFWIAADSRHLLCITLPSLTQEQASAIWAEIDQRGCGVVIPWASSPRTVTSSGLTCS